VASTHILATGRILDGEIHWNVAPLAADDGVQDGELQRLIDEAEMTADYESWLDDVEWMRSGC
jgi:hypothetical protein